MTIRIVSPNEIKITAGAIPPLLFADIESLYSKRAQRLRTLAQHHPLGDYLFFVSAVVDTQQQILKTDPLRVDLTEALQKAQENNHSPLSVSHIPRTLYWQRVLKELVAELLPSVPSHVIPVLDSLLKISRYELERYADYLLNGNYDKVGSDKAPFIWAALSLYWTQLASQLPGEAVTELGEQRQYCPICNSSPTASVIRSGSENGLRYLHCSLCETQWHMVRLKCSNCEQGSALSYWSLDDEQSAVKAESCSECNSYLKVFYQEKEPFIDTIADDLASLALDAKMEEENLAKSSINPFLFPA